MKPKKLLKAVITFLNAVVTVCVASIFVLMLMSFASKNGCSLFGYRSYIIMSGSMSPTFNAGSYLIIKEKEPKKIQAGDIITFQTGTDALVTHRVDKVIESGTLFVTKGDANNIRDIEPVPAEKILGEAVFWIENIGSLMLALKSPQNIIFCVLFLILWFILPELLFR